MAIEAEPVLQNSQVEQKQENSPNQNKKQFEILPKRLSHIAGEDTGAMEDLTMQNSFLNSKQIAGLRKTNNFNYFIQGSVGKTKPGSLIDEKQNAIVFLDIYNHTGLKLGMVNFTVKNRTLSMPSYLKKVAREISRHFKNIVTGNSNGDIQ